MLPNCTIRIVGAVLLYPVVYSICKAGIDYTPSCGGSFCQSLYNVRKALGGWRSGQDQ